MQSTAQKALILLWLIFFASNALFVSYPSNPSSEPHKNLFAADQNSGSDEFIEIESFDKNIDDKIDRYSQPPYFFAALAVASPFFISPYLKIKRFFFVKKSRAPPLSLIA
ncbi:hypothetical protein D0C16_06330 [Cellvibrio sp. KY-GH-1]|uniref:hypothetical protein n=1 Tax=Cellvibrio sp. KY-GH-1 TaxID=2303332 RepID=UPI00124710A3|nr:hypothetical protein [Cellvibrio sp. KY-GH-1]QEY15618.1 hypothetical protein D0C16_06330 [Cellvibrio sp. KY-GH-1]